jgi:hypothetical protein
MVSFAVGIANNIVNTLRRGLIAGERSRPRRDRLVRPIHAITAGLRASKSGPDRNVKSLPEHLV